MISRPLKLGFLASGNGSSARAIVAAIKAGDLAAEARLLVSNNRNAPALAFAAEEGVGALTIATQADPEAADARLAEALAAHGVEIIVLSGYLRQLGPETLRRYVGRVLNIHPGPLPRVCLAGHGMYGRRVSTRRWSRPGLPAVKAPSAFIWWTPNTTAGAGDRLADRASRGVRGHVPETLEYRVRK